MFYKILTVINALALLVVLGFTGYGMSTYGPAIMSNMDYFLKLSDMAKTVEMNSTDIADIKLTLNPFDGVDTLQYDGEFLRGFVDVTGFLDVKAVEGEASSASFRFTADNVNDSTLTEMIEELDNPALGTVNDEGSFTVSLGCPIENGLKGEPSLIISGDEYKKLVASSDAKPVHVRFFYGEMDGTDALCATTILAAQIVEEKTVDKTETVDTKSNSTKSSSKKPAATE